MAPTRQKKRKSTESTSSMDLQSFPAVPQLIPTKTRSPARTPTNRSPIRKQTMGITVIQKQALIDNLQLEITERARKLRAQYMLQAQGLRTRIEIRVNRIPIALRKATLGELLAKYNDSVTQAGSARKSPVKTHSQNKVLQVQPSRSIASPPPQRGAKRSSNEIMVDKENEDIENPKKRVRGPPQPPSRTTSRANFPDSAVLSPRSANSQTFTRSPIKPKSPAKSMLARPISPAKPPVPAPTAAAAGILTSMVEKAQKAKATATRKPAETTGAAGRGKRAGAPTTAAARLQEARGRAASDSSNSSASTTVIKKAAAAAPATKAAPAKRTVMSTIKGMGTKKASAPKPAVAAAPATSGRTLRKRT